MPRRPKESPPPRDPQQVIDELRRENERLREDMRRSEIERNRLRRENARLKEELEMARRRATRQAAPFSRGLPKEHPERPGRKAGAADGRAAHRPSPPRLDVTHDAPLPAHCPDCGGTVVRRRLVSQDQEGLPVPRPVVHEFRVAVGHCRQCHRRVQGRHPLQTSDAIGAAAVQLGPQAVALAVILNKHLGLSFGKIVQLLRDRVGLTVTRGGLVHAIEDGRGFAQAARMLGADDAGVLPRDGWAPYRPCGHAAHQTCLAHRPSSLSHEDAGPPVPSVCAAGAGAAAGGLGHARSPSHGHRLGSGPRHRPRRLCQPARRVLDRRPSRLADARRFATHGRTEFEAVFSVLFAPTLDATNWRAEHALRPAVITRKTCGGGNRTTRGAQTQQVLASVLRTAPQRGLSTAVLVTALQSPKPVVLDAFQSAPLH